MALTVQILITGLAAGAVYGLFAVAYSLVYRLTGVVHFALGELANGGVFVVLWVAAGTGPVTQTNVPGLRYAVAIGVATLLSALAGIVAYVVAVRPFYRRGSVVGWIGGLVALAFLVRTVLAAAFVRAGYVLPDILPFERVGSSGVVEIAGASLRAQSLFVVVVGVAIAAGAASLLSATKWGRGLRAIASDEMGARLTGVPIDRALAGAFAGAGVVALLAALATLPGGTVTVDSGAMLGLKGLVAAVLGGFRLPWPAFVAGLSLGLLEAVVLNVDLGPLQLGAPYATVVPLAAVVVILAARAWRAREATTE
jgi:branched-chain amino acid transport system permease protein